MAQVLNDLLRREKAKVAELQHDLVTVQRSLRKVSVKVLFADLFFAHHNLEEFDSSSSLRPVQTYFGSIQSPWLKLLALFTSLQAKDLDHKVEQSRALVFDASSIKQKYVSQS